MVLTAAAPQALASDPAAASDTPAHLNVILDAWNPASGNCTQQATFRLTPTAADQPEPTGTVTLLLDGDTPVGSAATVSGFGSYSITGACALDPRVHTVTLAYSGDATYAAANAASGAACGNVPDTDSTHWSALYSFAKPQPFFACFDNGGFSLRARDGRLLPGASFFGSASTPYGGTLDTSVRFDAEEPSAATAVSSPLSGTFRAGVDGRSVASRAAAGNTNVSWRLPTLTLNPGQHQWTVAYGGDQHWAPLTLFDNFALGKAVVSGHIGVKSWQLRTGQRPLMNFRLYNVLSAAAKPPTGKVDLYIGKRWVKSVTLAATDHGHRVVLLPAVHQRGIFRLRIVYHGDGRYPRKDSASARWYGNQQYIQVS